MPRFAGALIFAALCIAAAFLRAHAQGVCTRTAAVQEAIADETGEDCAEVTAEMLAAITELEVYSADGIPSFSAGDFSGLTALETLVAAENQLTYLPSGVFSALANLQELDLAQNNLTSLPQDVFGGLANLQTLDVSFNMLASLPQNVFSGLLNLRQLDIDSNALTALPQNLFSGLSNLQILDADRNNLAALPAGVFDGLTSLQRLDLNVNQLRAVPSGMFSELAALQRLDLHTNQLTSLPAGAFDGLTALQQLYLHTNQLAALSPGAFRALANLTVLELHGNQLTALPAALFGELPALERLSLRDNQLAALPDGVFTGLSELRNLSISGNRLRALPAGMFAALTSMTTLELNGNGVSRFELPARILRADLVNISMFMPHGAPMGGATFQVAQNGAHTYTLNIAAGATASAQVLLQRPADASQPLTLQASGALSTSWPLDLAAGSLTFPFPLTEQPRNAHTGAAAQSLTVLWDAAVRYDTDISGYSVRWETTNLQPNISSSANTTADAREYTITGLTAGTNYAVTVAARLGNATGDFVTAQGALTPAACNAQIDAGTVGARHGILIARYLLGVTQLNSLAQGQAAAADAAQIRANIHACQTGNEFDVDNDNATNSTDGLLLARYLAGLRDADLPRNIATTATAAAITQNIEALLP